MVIVLNWFLKLLSMSCVRDAGGPLTVTPFGAKALTYGLLGRGSVY